MEKHTKDEINFRGFLTAYRTMQGVEMQALTKGLYSKSMMSRVESGERLPKKLERDRLVARLGVSGEGYEDYLSMDEHAEWTLRQTILESIEEKNVEKLEEQLKIYASAEELDKVESQFLEAMRFMLLKMKGASDKELRETIELAVLYTIEDIEDGFPEMLILADQEINLLIEYVSLHQYSENEDECRKWRLARYQDIISYIEHSYMDDIGKVKVFPKLVYYICKQYLQTTCSLEELQKSLSLCREGIELIRDTRKMYYFVELLDMCQWNIERILTHKVFSEEYRCALREEAKSANEWAEMLTGLYEEYNVSPYMENFAYLYVETESHCINDVVRIRRKMLKMTQKVLASGVCDIKTVRRTEKREMSPQMYAVRGMFGNLGLCPEYVRGNVITHDPEVMALHLEVMRCDNEHRYDEWRENLDALEESLCMDIVQNRQAIMRERTMLEYETKKTSKEEAVMGLIDTLELTVPVAKCLKLNELYFTIEEINLLYNISGMYAKKKNIYQELLVKYYEKEMRNKAIMNRVDAYETLGSGLANRAGNKGEYELSNEIADEVIKVCLKNRRMRTLARNLYEKCWNKYNIYGSSRLKMDEPEVVTSLKRCLILSKAIRHKKLEEFFAAKLDAFCASK